MGEEPTAGVGEEPRAGVREEPRAGVGEEPTKTHLQPYCCCVWDCEGIFANIVGWKWVNFIRELNGNCVQVVNYFGACLRAQDGAGEVYQARVWRGRRDAALASESSVVRTSRRWWVYVRDRPAEVSSTLHQSSFNLQCWWELVYLHTSFMSYINIVCWLTSPFLQFTVLIYSIQNVEQYLGKILNI